MMRKAILLLMVMLLGACASTSTEVHETEYAGFLAQDLYNKLDKHVYKSGDVVYRWHSPNLKTRKYDKLLIERVTFWPEPQVTKQVDRQVLDEIADFFTEILRKRSADVVQVVDQAGPHTLQIKVAITGIKISTEGMRPWEIMPVAAALGAGSAVAGTRDQVIEVFFETRIQDSQTDEILAGSVRKIYGEKLENAKEQLNLDHLREQLEKAGDDVDTSTVELFGDSDK
jgi:hypothetical protein